jgi:ABC-type transport system involved in multi-copper enzyme maturation permease subunit
MRLAALSWLALRELWISFRLLILLGACLVAGIAQALVPQTFPTLLSLGLAATGVIAAFLAAVTLSGERDSGTAAWLVIRTVPRGHLVVGWLLAYLVPLLAGVTAAAALGWLAGGIALPLPVDPVAYAGVAAAVLGAMLASVALGLLAGVVLPRGAAALAAAALAGLLVGVGLLVGGSEPLVPAAGFGLLQELSSLTRPLSDGLEGLGLSFAMVAVLLGAAAAALEVADL